ncbi:hypothetical protein [Leptospira ilyithenensis]|uniref:Uncharacterized protein n=1 Tax=Leptospira ilyithenensis TaxID=2484901 RepID=A0A4R9LL90_9LEPT|nr:hypothetical protein [Leptospira ilyithenensis]TGN07005.1 hypothetical protein EHS11_17925 [Leptospira ilyithenensis]
MSNCQYIETQQLLNAYANWRYCVDSTEGSEHFMGTNSDDTVRLRDKREDAEIELRVLISDLKSTRPEALQEWVEINKTLLEAPANIPKTSMVARRQAARDWKFSKSFLGVTVRYPHPSKYWGAEII